MLLKSIQPLCFVAPRAGAWIETASTSPTSLRLSGSPPARGRGLKLLAQLRQLSLVQSPPARGRGLKLNLISAMALVTVAPRAGAWIETSTNQGQGLEVFPSPPARGRGLKLYIHIQVIYCRWSPPARGRGLKHRTHTHCLQSQLGRPPRGGVD